MVRILAIIVLVTGVWGNSTAQELNPEIEEIVKLMAEDGLVLRGPYGGRSNTKLPGWSKFEDLKSLATTETLIELMDHDSPIVRCYAFQALVTREDVSILPILRNHLNDTVVVSARWGCILDSKPVRDHLINMAYPKGDVTLEDIDVNWKRN